MAYNQKETAGRGNMPKTGRGIPTNMVSPLNAFPIGKGTKLQEGESVLVTGAGGRTYKYDNIEQAKAKRGEERMKGVKSSLTGVTEVSPGEYTEQRRSTKTGKLLSEKQEKARLKSKKYPNPQVKSPEAQAFKKDYTETFTLKSTGEEDSPVGEAYDRVYGSDK
jgi:hypothetical protein